MGDAEHQPGRDEPKLRRALLGYRRKDVEAELIARRTEIEQLRGDVAALQRTYDQHERSIRHLIAAIEALEGTIAPASGSAAAQARAGEQVPAFAPDAITAQLDDLRGVLAAIEKATRSLEHAHGDEVAPGKGTPSGEAASGPRPEPS